MKLHVLYDKDGHIAAAARLDGDVDEMVATPRPEGKAATRRLPRPITRPLPKEGQHTAVVFIPPEHSYLDLVGVCQRLKVDVRAKLPALVPKS